MGNLREVFAMSTAETSMITDWSTEGGYDPDTGTAGRPPGQGKFLLKLGKKAGIPFHLDLTTVEGAVNDSDIRDISGIETVFLLQPERVCSVASRRTVIHASR